jgi:hypothetical protein
VTRHRGGNGPRVAGHWRCGQHGQERSYAVALPVVALAAVCAAQRRFRCPGVVPTSQHTTFHRWSRVRRLSRPGVMPRSGVRGIGGTNRIDHGRPERWPLTSQVSETPDAVAAVLRDSCRRGDWTTTPTRIHHVAGAVELHRAQVARSGQGQVRESGRIGPTYPMRTACRW